MSPELEARAVALEAKIDAASARWDALERENLTLRGNLRFARAQVRDGCKLYELVRADNERLRQWGRETADMLEIVRKDNQRLRDIVSALQGGDGGRG